MAADAARVTALVKQNEALLACYRNESTHYEGCAADHPLCALRHTTDALAALAAENARLAAPLTARDVHHAAALANDGRPPRGPVREWDHAMAAALNARRGRPALDEHTKECE